MNAVQPLPVRWGDGAVTWRKEASVDTHHETVLAGSRDFALALFVPMTERAGLRPRVATEATQALTLLEHPGLEHGARAGSREHVAEHA